MVTAKSLLDNRYVTRIDGTGLYGRAEWRASLAPWLRVTGGVDLSVGTPVDPTPEVVQQALRDAADSPGYPMTIGRPDTRQACIDWLERRHGVTGLGLDAVLPVIGSKELIASLPPCATLPRTSAQGAASAFRAGSIRVDAYSTQSRRHASWLASEYSS